MNLNKKTLEQITFEKSPDEKALDELRIISGYGIKISLQDQSIDLESNKPDDAILEGTLDAGVNFRQPIYLDEGKKHTAPLCKIIRKGGKTFIITDDTVYWLRIVPPEQTST
jgi:hypothetical protein